MNLAAARNRAGARKPINPARFSAEPVRFETPHDSCENSAAELLPEFFRAAQFNRQFNR